VSFRRRRSAAFGVALFARPVGAAALSRSCGTLRIVGAAAIGHMHRRDPRRRIMAKNLRVVGLSMFLLAACNTPPPQAWLRYQPNGQHPWVAGPDGQWLTRLHGVDVAMDLSLVETRIQVTVTNASGAPLDVRMGAEAVSSTKAIGDVLLRAIDGPPGVVGPEWIGYVSMTSVVVEAGWRATFNLDQPLAREPALGQSFLLTVEGKNRDGVVERRSMPLIATNAGTLPRDRR
jgi:hypothetical protein